MPSTLSAGRCIRLHPRKAISRCSPFSGEPMGLAAGTWSSRLPGSKVATLKCAVNSWICWLNPSAENHLSRSREWTRFPGTTLRSNSSWRTFPSMMVNAAFRVPIFSICRAKKPSSFAPNGRFRRSRRAGCCNPRAPDPRSPQPLRDGVQKLVFAVQVHADPQPIEREGCEQVTGVFAEVDQVLLGGEDRLDAVVAELAAHIAQLVWLVGVVILEFDEREGCEQVTGVFAEVDQVLLGGEDRLDAEKDLVNL